MYNNKLEIGDNMVKDLCFEIIEACPNNCKFCSSNSCITKERIISFDDFKRVIDYFMSTGGIEELSLSGGEPFLHPDLLRMVEYAKRYDIRTVIFTSGVAKLTKLSSKQKEYYISEMNKYLKDVEEREPWNERLKNNIKRYYNHFINPNEYSCLTKDILNKLKLLGLDKIVFDFQAYESDTDKYIMGRDDNKRMALLDSLINASSIGLDIDVHFVPMKPNFKEIIDVLELLEIAHIKNISLLNFVPQGRGRINQDELLLDEHEKEEFFALIAQSKKYYSGNIRIGIPLQGESTHKCNAGLEKIDIKFDGTILPCPAFKELTKEECKKYNIKLYSIYEDLESFNIPGKGTRVVPLCQKVYQNKK